MPLDEVNERFPATKYKSWRAHRERMGLPSEGGIKTAPNSRPGSVKHIEAAIPSTEETPISPTAPSPLLKEILGPSTASRATPSSTAELAKETSTPLPPTTVVAETSSTNESKRLSEISDIDHRKDSDNDDDDDEHLHAAVPEELLNTSGDSCAICIDVIDEDDDIRGLTCGHAFHTACLDPWLTSRRACCPLCKADYYTPKPRTETENSSTDENGNARSRSTRQTREPAIPQDVYIGPPFHRRTIFSGRFMSSHRSEQRRIDDAHFNTLLVEAGFVSATSGRSRWLRNPLRGILPSARRGGNSSEEPTPGALEAGLNNRANESGTSTPAARPIPTPSPLHGAGTH